MKISILICAMLLPFVAQAENSYSILDARVALNQDLSAKFQIPAPVEQSKNLYPAFVKFRSQIPASLIDQDVAAIESSLKTAREASSYNADNFKLLKDKDSLLKNFYALSSYSLCSKYLSRSVHLNLNGVISMGRLAQLDAYQDQLKDNSAGALEKSLQANKIFYDLSTCHNEIVGKLVSLHELSENLLTLSAINKTKASDVQTKAIADLKSSVDKITTDGLFKDALVFEVTDFYRIWRDDIQKNRDTISKKMFTSTTVDDKPSTKKDINELIALLLGDNRVKIDLQKENKSFAHWIELINQTPADSIHQTLADEADKSRENFYQKLNLSQAGLGSAADLKDSDKLSTLIQKISGDNDLRKKMQDQFAKILGKEDLIAFGVISWLNPKEDVYDKFTKRVKDVQAASKKL